MYDEQLANYNQTGYSRVHSPLLRNKKMGRYEDGEGRFWIHDDPTDRPYGEDTLGIVDEKGGGIIAYVGSWNLAELLITLLRTTE